MTSRNLISAGFAGAVLAVSAGAAIAAGDGTGIEAGFTETANALTTLFAGAGGYIIMIVSLFVGVVMLAMGKGFTPLAVALGAGFVLAYGVPALTGISGVSAETAILETTLLGEQPKKLIE